MTRNGYEFQIDGRQRTRRITGALTLPKVPVRSRKAQAQAGGKDRRLSDDGGHYIAARFNGPREAFNHFAQDANFNRGGYRALEDEWAKAKRAGKKVSVRIVPIFEGASKRPSIINVWYWIDGDARVFGSPMNARRLALVSDKTERLLKEIGGILAEDLEYPLEGTLLHADVDWNVVGPSIFKPRGNHILYRDPDLDRICDPILELWEQEKPGKRWSEMEYVVRDGKFVVAFTYPEEIDRTEERLDRRTRIVKRHFGDLPIVYPPFPDDDNDAQTFEP